MFLIRMINMNIIRLCRFLVISTALWISINLEASCLPRYEVEAKVSAFLPSSKIVRRIHSDAMPYYEVEIAKSFRNNWQVWLGSGYLSNNGHSIGYRNKTCFYLIPVTFGLKYFYSACPCTDLYAGAGACWSFLKDKDHSRFVHKNISNDGPGGIFKLGCVYRVKEHIFIDIFAEYLYQRFSFHHHYEDHYTIRHKLNMSGLKIGGGAGFNF